MRSVCVYCGSSRGKNNIYRQAAVKLGKELAENHLTLVYGGGNIGLMGDLASAAMANGGNVIGIIPKGLFRRDLAKKDVSQLIIVRDMHERKAKMAELSDGFIALPGGIGTLEEFAEALTWNQLKIHQKPCAILNAGGYFDPLISYLKRSVSEGFYSTQEKSKIIVEKDPAVLVHKLMGFRNLRAGRKWKEVLES